MKRLRVLLVFQIGYMAFAADGDIRIISRGSGGWKYLDPTAPTVRRDAPILGTPSANGMVLECGKEDWRSYTCNGVECKVKPCQPGSDVKELQVYPAHGMIAQLQQKVASIVDSLLTRQTRAPVLLAARAGGSPNDSLLLQDEMGVHWGPALRRVLEGKYCFQLTHLLSKSEARTFLIEWDREKNSEGPVRVDNLKPGGYLLQKGKGEDCTPDPEASPSWVVVAPQAEFSALKADWDKTGEWLDKVSEDGATLQTLATVRRAVLSAMADSLEPR